jgi:ABC-type oligopeptide transport system substrate-binding subunit
LRPIVPEGTTHFGSSWRDGAVGTGPFRVVNFEPSRRLELERNPHYWREGYPRSEGIVFRFGVQPEEMRSEFLAGRFSVASDSPAAGRGSSAAGPPLRLGLQGVPPTFDVLRGVQHPPAGIRRPRRSA